MSPVLVGTAVAAADGRVVVWRALAAMVVALALQVGVNYANDYSDGKRGTDANRRGPMRLVASGAAPAAAVKAAAIGAFGLAAVVGLLVALATDWKLILVGAACIAAGALYTGGPKPYGYMGLGEVMVMIFFGFVATVGSTWVHLERIDGVAVWAAVPVGLLACALLVVNNLRDVETDRESGKVTLAVRLGAAGARLLYRACLVGAFFFVALLALARPPAALALLAFPLAVPPLRVVARRRDAPSLIAALMGTARLQLWTCLALAAGLWAS